MGDKSRLSPEQSFPADLAPLEDSQVEILNSKVNRQLDLEYIEDQEVDPETESRYEELKAELDYRAGEDSQPPVDGRDALKSSAQEPKDKASA
ncbi:hypothetical protein [Arthrobacter sp. HLT1-21]